MSKVKVENLGYRSLFWPIVLISVGVIWLLGNLGVLTGANLMVLLRLWPLLLIVIGLDLLFGRTSPLIGALIGIGSVVLIVALMLIGPSIGLAGPQMEATVDTFSEPRGDATSAAISISPSVGSVYLTALSDSPNLFEATVAHVGKIEYQVEGQTEKRITLRENEVSTGPSMEFLGFAIGQPQQDLYWNISLDPTVPVALNISGGVGQSTYDLSSLTLTDLNVNTGVGQTTITLPNTGAAYAARISSGVGEVRVTIEDGASVTLNISGGVGSTFIDVPNSAAVRLDASSGLGGVNVPGSFARVSGENNDGTWETAGFASASARITIVYNGGVGGLTIR
jgi:predicted membrane protein